MVKPAGSLCNLDCSYCFYLHKPELLGYDTQEKMSDIVLEQHIRQYIEAQTGEEVIFSWQGGEPTVMGLDFFRTATKLQKKHKKSKQTIQNDLQTNGLLINEEWARFLKMENFSVGLSLDGPPELHDKHRPTKAGSPSAGKVLKAAELLSRYEIPFTILCVVNRDVAQQPLTVWRFLTGISGTYKYQFTPCVEPKTYRHEAPRATAQSPAVGAERSRPGHPLSIVTEWSVDARDYGLFLCQIWDEWLKHDLGRVHVNVFEDVVAQMLGLPAQMCTSAPICGKAMAVERDGTLYSCDHFVYPEFKLGNILKSHEGNLAFSHKQVSFGINKHDSLPSYCKSCEVLKLCWGECPKNRILKTPDGQLGLNYLCEGLKRFYIHALNDLPKIRQHLSI